MQASNHYHWEPLKLADLPQIKQCKMCGQDHHLLPLNEHIVFWVHQGKELDKCCMVAFKTSYIHGLKSFLDDKKQHLKNQIDGDTDECVNLV